MFYVPPLVRERKREIRVEYPKRIKLRKISKSTKFVSPNADLLPVLFDLLKASISFSAGELEVVPTLSYGHAVSLTGLLRALLVLRAKDPGLYEGIVELARLLSVEFSEDETVSPPFVLMGQPSKLKHAFVKVREVLGVSEDDYKRAVITLAIETGIFDKISFFSFSGEEDEKMAKELLGSLYYSIGNRKVIPSLDSDEMKERFIEIILKNLEELKKEEEERGEED